MKKHLALSGLVTGLLLCAVPCSADIISIGLTPALLSGPPGSILSFSGTLTNTGLSTVFLNSAGINLAGGVTPADEDTAGFFINAPLFLFGGDSTLGIDLFTINVSNGLAAGVYGGTFTVLGGVDGGAQNIVGSTNFTVHVISPTAVPEPGSGTLLAATCFFVLVACVTKRCGSRAVLVNR